MYMFYKQFSDGTEESFMILCKEDSLPPSNLPVPLEPKGLDQQRKLYLFKEICQFCIEGTEDLIAPKP